MDINKTVSMDLLFTPTGTNAEVSTFIIERATMLASINPAIFNPINDGKPHKISPDAKTYDDGEYRLCVSITRES